MNLFVIGMQNESKYRFICYLGKYLSGKYRVGIVSLYRQDSYESDVFEIEEQEDIIVNKTIVNTYDYDVVIYDVSKDRDSLEEGKRIFYSTIDKSSMDKNKPVFTSGIVAKNSFFVYDQLMKGSSIDKRFICNYFFGSVVAGKNILFIHNNLNDQKVMVENDFKQHYSLKRLKGEYLNTIINLCNKLELTREDEMKNILKVCERR